MKIPRPLSRCAFGVALVAVLGLAAGVSPASAAGGHVVTGVYIYRPYLDPQEAWSNYSTSDIYDTYLPLLTYRRANGRAGSEVIPGLARSLPRIGDGGRTYTLFLRRGLRYSDGEPIRAGDFKSTVERLFRIGRRGEYGGAEHFFMVIAGAAKFERRASPSIPGVVTDDRTGRIVIHLRRPEASFTRKLAMTWTALVPRGTPSRDLSRDPPPASGPYAISRVGRDGWTYTRNPEWARRNGKLIPGVPAGHLDEIRIVVVRDASRAVDAVEGGRYDWISEEVSGPESLRLRKRFPSRVRLEPTLSTEYFWLDTSTAPFDDPSVRRAVNYAVERGRFRRLSGGQLLPSSQILPPDLPGFRRTSVYPHDLAKARALIDAADPPRRPLTVWTYEAPGDPTQATYGRYFASVLRQLGFPVRLKVLGVDRYYASVTDPSKPHLDAGVGNYFANYPGPDDFLGETLGSPVDPFYNENLARFDPLGLSRSLERLAMRPGPATSESGYAALDRAYTRLAPWVPIGNYREPLIVSGRIRLKGVVSNPTFGVTLTSLQLKRAGR